MKKLNKHFYRLAVNSYSCSNRLKYFQFLMFKIVKMIVVDSIVNIDFLDMDFYI